MKYDPNKHHRRSIRLKGYDYSQAGAYFITICAYQRQCLFGEIVDGVMELNDYGQIAIECWGAIPQHFPLIQLDGYVVISNHLHGILVVTDMGRDMALPIGANLRSQPRCQGIEPSSTLLGAGTWKLHKIGILSSALMVTVTFFPIPKLKTKKTPLL